MILRIAIYEGGKKKVNLWLPLLILYLLLVPIFIFLMPVFVLIGLGLWVFGMGTPPFSLMAWIYELWCAARGTIIETKSKSDRVLVHIL
jgi:hypothetical protein